MARGQPSHRLHAYAESADGRQFLMLKDLKAREANARPHRVVEHWFEELTQPMPTSGR